MTRTLRPLSPEECAVLWESVSGQGRSAETMRGLRILTGGNVRLLTIVARFGARLSFRDLMADLLELIDDLTEYFKSHIESLPAQERRVYLALAELWEPATAREVAARVRLDTSKCSAQLNRLVDRGVVEIVGGGARRKLYYLSERLYNIYYLLRRSRTPIPLIEALIRFMHAYYSPPQLKDVASRMVSEAAGLQSYVETLHWTAFARLIDLPALAPYRNELLSVSPRTFSESEIVGASAAETGRALANTPASLAAPSMAETSRTAPGRQDPWLAGEPVQETSPATVHNQPENKDVTVRTVLQNVDADSSLSKPAEIARAIVQECNSFLLTGRPEAALAACAEIEHRYGASHEAGVRLQVARALVRKAIALEHLGRTQGALEVYEEIARRFAHGLNDAAVAQVATALANKAIVLRQLNRDAEAVAACDDVVQRFGDSTDPETCKHVARALVTKGVVFSQQGLVEQELPAFEDVVRRYADSGAPEVIEQVCRAMYFKAAALGRLGKTGQELAAYDEVGRASLNNDAPGVQTWAARALVDKGIALGRLNLRDEELATYAGIVRQFGNSDYPPIREQVAGGRFSRVHKP